MSTRNDNNTIDSNNAYNSNMFTEGMQGSKRPVVPGSRCLSGVPKTAFVRPPRPDAPTNTKIATTAPGVIASTVSHNNVPLPPRPLPPRPPAVSTVSQSVTPPGATVGIAIRKPVQPPPPRPRHPAPPEENELVKEAKVQNTHQDIAPPTSSSPVKPRSNANAVQVKTEEVKTNTLPPPPSRPAPTPSGKQSDATVSSIPVTTRPNAPRGPAPRPPAPPAVVPPPPAKVAPPSNPIVAKKEDVVQNNDIVLKGSSEEKDNNEIVVEANVAPVVVLPPSTTAPKPRPNYAPPRPNAISEAKKEETPNNSHMWTVLAVGGGLVALSSKRLRNMTLVAGVVAVLFMIFRALLSKQSEKKTEPVVVTPQAVTTNDQPQETVVKEAAPLIGSLSDTSSTSTDGNKSEESKTTKKTYTGLHLGQNGTASGAALQALGLKKPKQPS